jgi:p-hydroxybenzoate 3-monooxygenase
MRTQVAIIGAGPAGLLLAQLLHREGIDSVILEAKSRDYIEHRVRAGVLEHQSVDILNEAGVGARMMREGLVHDGVIIQFAGVAHRIDLTSLTGHGVMIYGQQEVVKDLVEARIQSGRPLYFDVGSVSIHDFDSSSPYVKFQHGGAEQRLDCAFIAACDGFHGVCRASLPPERIGIFERIYPFAWLGILADAQPASDELIYSHHERGFALLSMRSPSVSRLYLQCKVDENLDEWPDERVWEELQKRFDRKDGSLKLRVGPITQKSVTPMRSFVAEPMRHGRLFLTGDAAHIVPPTGAKGMNLAVADVKVLSLALAAHYHENCDDGLESFSATCLRRIWKVQRFSWWMTSILHQFETDNAFDRRRQVAELDYIVTSKVAAETLAENYIGLPLELNRP